MKQFTTILLSLLLAVPLFAQTDGKQQLIEIFKEAEQCYLMDDYQQLQTCLTNYSDVFTENQSALGDSTDVYLAYYYKMCGAYYYGLAEDDSCAYYAELCYRRSLDVFNSRNNVTNALVLHEELAQLYYKIRAYDQAKVQLDSVYNYYDERLHDMGITSVMPNYYKTISQLAMCNGRLGNFDLALEQIDEAIDDYYKKQKDADYFEALRKRGKILMMQADSLGSTHYKKAVESYQQYVNERYASIGNEMSTMNDSQRNQYWLATHQFLYDCFRLGNRAPEMLYDLTLFSKDYLVRKNAVRMTWKQVKQALGKNDCAIEFVQYYGKNDERRMGCLVLRNNSKKPLFIDMFATDSVLDLPLTRLHTIGSAIIYSENTVKDTLYRDERLPHLIWNKALMAAIGDATRIYFAPDGLFHQLAIEYLMPDDAKLCHRLSSTRVLTQKRTSPKMNSALLCGGITFDASFQPNERDNDEVAYRFMAPHATSIKSLPWTRREVDSVLAVRNNPKDKMLVGENATDEAFINLLHQEYNVIHLATHGFFGGRIGIYNDIKPLLNDESMSMSGLLFAGSVSTLADRSFDMTQSDGVLSAAELAKQDMSNTELIVLSACQTGLGHLTDDGICGIQRALKLAGANAMILSLWSVDDYATCMLMRYFYEELGKQSRKDILVAFLNARVRLMIEEKVTYEFDPSTFTYYKKIKTYDKPQYVNPFIIIDAI